MQLKEVVEEPPKVQSNFLRKRILNLLTYSPMTKLYQQIMLKSLLHMRKFEIAENIPIVDEFIEKILEHDFRDDPPVPDR